MTLPEELWDDPTDRRIARETVEAFAPWPIVLTDRIANAIFLNEQAEAVFGDRADAIVNRTTYSLLGFMETKKLPPALAGALTSNSAPWRGVVALDTARGPERRVIEASAIHRNGLLVCGLLRIAHDTNKGAPDGS